MRTGPFLLAIALLLALVGCVPSGSPATSAPSESATPVFASDAEALAAAEKAYAAYQKVSDQIGADGGTRPERIDDFATGKLKQADLAGYETLRAKQWRTIGLTEISSVALQSTDLSSRSVTELVVAYVCLNVGGVDVVDAVGNSVVAASRPDVQAFQVGFDKTGSGLIPSSREPWTGADVCAH